MVGPQDLQAALLLVPFGPAAVSGHGSPRPLAANWAGESPQKRSYGAPQRGSMAGLVLPSGHPLIVGTLRDRTGPSAARLGRQRLLSCGPVMLVVIQSGPASNRQVGARQSAEVGS
jgi:hypothetical protein